MHRGLPSYAVHAFHSSHICSDGNNGVILAIQIESQNRGHRSRPMKHTNCAGRRESEWLEALSCLTHLPTCIRSERAGIAFWHDAQREAFVEASASMSARPMFETVSLSYGSAKAALTEGSHSQPVALP
jgi:hypothetical protein